MRWVGLLICLVPGWAIAQTVPTNYTLDLSAITVPNLPSEVAPRAGTWVTANNVNGNYLSDPDTNVFDDVLFPGTGNGTTVLTWTVGFANTAQPTSSYYYPGADVQPNLDEYELLMTRGSGEPNALQFGKRQAGTPVRLGSAIGTPNVTFAPGERYSVTFTITGTTTRTLTAQVQRVSDGMWLTSAGTYAGTQQTCLTYADSSPIPPTGVSRINIYQSVASDTQTYQFGVHNWFPTLTRYSSSPVLAKGATYGGWTGDALAAPAAVYDGTQYVMTVSLWSVANSQWASAFFTSPNMKTWSYLASSLLAPTGGDYILGNSGLAWFGGKYYFAFNHYASGAGTTPIALWSSTDLIHWTTVASPLIADGSDPSLAVNPNNSKLELWYGVGPVTARSIHLSDSPDGVTWTDEGSLLSQSIWITTDFGEASAFYFNSTRYLSFDAAPETGGYRYTGLYDSPTFNSTWIWDSVFNGPDSLNAWENAEVFDMSCLVANLGDGLGSVPRCLYAGGDNHSATDNTNSSIGLGYMLAAGSAPALAHSLGLLGVGQ